MAIAEDAATVLEQFVHDAANLPAEIAHLMEEIQAKEQQIQDCRSIIQQRDGSIQKFIKQNSTTIKNPKEDMYHRTVLQNYDKVQILQEEKVGLAEKAAALLDRQIKRLDIKIRDLQTSDSMPIDPTLPSLLRESPGNLVPPASSVNTGANTPGALTQLSNNVQGGSTSIANAAIHRLTGAMGRVGSPSVAGMQPHALLHPGHPSNPSSLAAVQRQRETSVSSDSKKRRLNQSIGPLPTAASSLRQSSLGPGTPKAGTPGSRAGSAGPRPAKKSIPLKNNPAARRRPPKAAISKKSRQRLLGGSRGSPSTGDEESVLSIGSEDELSALQDGNDDMDVDEGEDDTKYCYCQQVSYGDMIACDNDNCKIQWFHYDCVNLTEEPKGLWICPECNKLPKQKWKLTKDALARSK